MTNEELLQQTRDNLAESKCILADARERLAQQEASARDPRAFRFSLRRMLGL